MKAHFKTEGIYSPDELVAGNAHLLVARKVTIASGQNLLRGSVLGQKPDTKYVLCDASHTDGSQNPDLILAEDVDATAGEAFAMAYSRGDFVAQALQFGTGYTVDNAREALRAKGITLVSAVA